MGWLARLHCGRVRRQRWQYLDGTLSDRQRAAIEAHLMQCIGCRAEYARAACALESLQKGLPLEPDMLPARPRRWRIVLLLTLTVLGAGSGLWLSEVSGRSREVSPERDTQATLNPSPQPSPKRGEGDSRISPQREEGVAKILSPSGGESAGEGALHSTPSRNRSPLRGEGAAKTLSPSGGEGTGEGVRRTTTKPTARKKRPARSAPKPAPPPEGTIEVYDESGQLIRRDNVRGTR